MAWHLSKSKFDALVERALADLPEPFAGFLEEVPVEVLDRPTRIDLRGEGFSRDKLLLGYYHGLALTERSVEYSGVLPGVIRLFQTNIEAICDSEEDLVREVRTTVLHEIGHHFGMTEEDLDELGYG
jgi:predicted Zn-dependent protease with MMP-like domain